MRNKYHEHDLYQQEEVGMLQNIIIRQYNPGTGKSWRRWRKGWGFVDIFSLWQMKTGLAVEYWR